MDRTRHQSTHASGFVDLLTTKSLWLSIITLFLQYGLVPYSSAFLFDGDVVSCPNPATNCLQETFNRVLPNFGCLGCQSGCKPGYIMTANPNHFIREGNISGSYDFQGVMVPNTKNVSEPQWLCEKGDKCRWGYFADKMGANDVCSYCGVGCLQCQSYDMCEQCIPGYRPHKATIAGGLTTAICISSGVPCPNQPDHCQYESYVIKSVGCMGCVYCEDGYIPGFNPNYRRHGDNATTGYYNYQGLNIAGGVEINEPRYTCLLGDVCPPGWLNYTRGDIQTCEFGI